MRNAPTFFFVLSFLALPAIADEPGDCELPRQLRDKICHEARSAENDYYDKCSGPGRESAAQCRRYQQEMGALKRACEDEDRRVAGLGCER